MNHPFDSNNKDLAERWSQWQPDAQQHTDETQDNGLPERRKAGKHRRILSLFVFVSSAKPC